ncbi:MAG TPA: alpha/beta fold hydrolase [Micromonosporaceae bacterium]
MTRGGFAAVKLNYERRGAGEPLVLIHGFGHHWYAWEPVLDRLAATHDVIAIDLPGFGSSPMPAIDQPPTMAGTVHAIAAFLDQLGVHRPHVAGNSLGGGIALEFAAAGHAASVTAFAPAGFFTDWERRWAVTLLRLHRATARLPVSFIEQAMQVPALKALTFSAVVARPDRIAPERALSDALALRNGPAFEPVARASRGYTFAGRPTVPVTVAWGTRDRILPYWQAKRAQERLPHARHVAMPGCGHVPMGDDPDLVASIILDTTAAAIRQAVEAATMRETRAGANRPTRASTATVRKSPPRKGPNRGRRVSRGSNR